MLNLSTRWRVWFAALLLLALPMQGYAAATMAACGAGLTGDWRAQVGTASAMAGHTLVQHRTVQRDLQGQQAQHAQHAQPLDRGHDAHTAAVAQHHAGHAQHLSAADAGQTQADSSCSVCAACFIGAALPVSEARFAAHAQPQGYCVGAVTAVQFTQQDGPERPPRISLD